MSHEILSSEAKTKEIKMKITDVSNQMDVDILINGIAVKKYYKDGKTYIQANSGSEYEIQIKNNTSTRVLAIASVDGLDVLTGEQAAIEGGGYIINPYQSYRIKGFRYDSDHVGSFKFTNKNNSYAATKGEESKINCGVIGVCVYAELPSYYISILNTLNDACYKTKSVSPEQYKVFWNSTTDNDGLLGQTYKSSILRRVNQNIDYSEQNIMCCDISEKQYSTFDMGSTWGKKAVSKVVEDKFERGAMIYSTEIFYASRQSLIESGVIQDNKPKIAFPKSFPVGFAKPPDGWTGNN